MWTKQELIGTCGMCERGWENNLNLHLPFKGENVSVVAIGEIRDTVRLMMVDVTIVTGEKRHGYLPAVAIFQTPEPISCGQVHAHYWRAGTFEGEHLDTPFAYKLCEQWHVQTEPVTPMESIALLFGPPVEHEVEGSPPLTERFGQPG